MRYAVFTDVHANLEALEAVLAKIDELAQQEPIDAIWFLGDLVGYGPNPNECITLLRKRTDVIIAGNHDWAAVGKIDLDDFSAAARISAEWTAEQLTPEYREFLINLPERIEIGECTLVHGSPYGPLWEYLTSEALAERSFQYFTSRYCFVGHTHVPLIFQQLDPIANTPTLPLESASQSEAPAQNGESPHADEENMATEKMAAVSPAVQTMQVSSPSEHALTDAASTQASVTEVTDGTMEASRSDSDTIDTADTGDTPVEEAEEATGVTTPPEPEGKEDTADEVSADNTHMHNGAKEHEVVGADSTGEMPSDNANADNSTSEHDIADEQSTQGEEEPHTQATMAEEPFSDEIEELLELLGLSQSMIKVTNEMIVPPEGDWQAPDDYRAIVNPGGVGQPRDGDPRAALMIYDTKRGFTFYRIPYAFEKTQEKIIAAGLPQYLATRLAYGR
jgi:diadenosine tetraphosphatase ApaH/serine/threonine PP2A family protein phosphatase